MRRFAGWVLGAFAIAGSPLEAPAVEFEMLGTDPGLPSYGKVVRADTHQPGVVDVLTLSPGVLGAIGSGGKRFATDGSFYYTFDLSSGEIHRITLDGASSTPIGQMGVNPSSYPGYAAFATDGTYFYWMRTLNNNPNSGRISRASIHDPSDVDVVGFLDLLDAARWQELAADGIHFYVRKTAAGGSGAVGDVARAPMDLDGASEPAALELVGSVAHAQDYTGFGRLPIQDACRGRMRGEPVGLRTPGGETCEADPETPAVLRNLAPVQGGEFVDPHIPPVRTSRDGRIGLNTKGGSFFLLSPEKIGSHFVESTPGPEILGDASLAQVATGSFHDEQIEGSVGHFALCDVGRGWGAAGEQGGNPYACGDDDCYDLGVVVGYDHANEEKVTIFTTPVTVRVTDPKKTQAALAPVMVLDEQQRKSPALDATGFFEATVTQDGRLLVARTGTKEYQLQPPSPYVPPPGTDPQATPFTSAQTVQIVYSILSPEDSPCDAEGWTELRPISWAPYDWDLREAEPPHDPLYDLAAFPFRDASGEPIQPGRDLGATYPWIDRRGRNLFFTTISDTLHYRDSTLADAWRGRLETKCFPAEFSGCTLPEEFEDPASPLEPESTAAEQLGSTRGMAMLGSWSHGKMVLLDGLSNHIDFGIPTPDVDHRILVPYTTAAGELQEAEIRVGSGRENRNAESPDGSVKNSTLIDSTEHLFNADPDLRPITAQEVVWIMNRGHGTTELPFDDVLHPDGFIVSEMVPLLRMTTTQTGTALQTEDGFDDGLTSSAWYSGGPVSVQNGGTAPPDRWALPALGEVHGFARTESIALGGVRGRGLWLDGEAGITYLVPSQPQDPTAVDWYFGLFVDPRWPEGELAEPLPRRLVTFPDGASVGLEGPDHVVLLSPTGQELERFTLPPEDAVAEKSWTHLGFAVRREPGSSELGGQVDFYLDGFLQDRWRLSEGPGGATPAFVMGPGTVVVGEVPGTVSPGLRGWVDDFKVFAAVPNLEVACNLAHGTLIDVGGISGSPWYAAATRRQAWVQAEVASGLAANGVTAALSICFTHHASEPMASHHVPAGAVSLREEYLFPEGPLQHDLVRPDSTSNEHCTACHVEGPGRPSGLTLAALTEGQVILSQDPRRQPLQPPPRLYGHVPADLYGPGRPPEDKVAPASGCFTDKLVFTSEPVPASWCGSGGGGGGCGLGFEAGLAVAGIAALRRRGRARSGD